MSQNTAGPQVRTFKSYMTTKKLHGKRNVLNIEDLSASVGSNPADVGFFLTAIQSIDDGVSSTSVYVRSEIVYYVEFFGQQNVAAS